MVGRQGCPRARAAHARGWRARIAGLALVALASAAFAPLRRSGSRSLAYAVPGAGAAATEVEEARQPSDVAKAESGAPARAADPYKRLKMQKRGQRKRKKLQVGDELRGWVASVNDGIAYVNVGLQRPGTLAANDALPEHMEPEQAVRVWVTNVRRDGGVWLTSIKPRKSSLTLREGEKLKGTVTHLAEFGGAFVDVGADKRGLLHVRDMAEGWVESVTDLVMPGQEVTVWVREVRKDGDFTLNMYKPRIPVNRLRPGMKLKGKVRMVTEFGGAFVDVGAERDGLLTSRAMSDAGVTKVAADEELTVWIREVREEKDFQLALSKPRLPLKMLKAGRKLEGKITGICDFGGFFVDVGAMRDGLVNSDDVSADMENSVEGESVDVWVKQVRGDSLQLTMKEPTSDVFKVMVGQKVRGKVTGFSRQGGAFIDIGAANDALLRKDQIPSELQPVVKVIPVPGGLAPEEPEPAAAGAGSALKVGQEVDVWIMAKHRDKKIDLTMIEEVAEQAEDRTNAYFKGSRGIL
eukprot:CAMPEP_0195076112 /NCGR_PEP_ID=MMETSP0448-20130528/18831_1 /TAXON_ID=66468 /ORGANISM="Heterocapsa triquestra, Strain CCMP 448" /LENGTH=521 /DNA_ID=CAMNT_0040108579 /DNA_START=25 /DNA_END=1590 /DNA_ORIENTATION=+